MDINLYGTIYWNAKLMPTFYCYHPGNIKNQLKKEDLLEEGYVCRVCQPSRTQGPVCQK